MQLSGALTQLRFERTEKTITVASWVAQGKHSQYTIFQVAELWRVMVNGRLNHDIPDCKSLGEAQDLCGEHELRNCESNN